MKLLALAMLLAVASARPQREAYPEDVRSREQPVDDRRITSTQIPILQWNKQQDVDGTYKTNYETGNNIIAEESGYIKTLQGSDGESFPSLVQEGQYSYQAPDGTVITTRYIANENGFQVSGDHLPTPPPVSEEIQKGLDLIYEGIRLQEEEAKREAASKPGQQALAQSGDRRDEKDRIYQRQ
ncbi:endocuticle structural glycoprotein SgAbd-4 [Neodiprion pinetum]|uniref:Endocuticle structural glycoprotein SgAbd-2 n=1 Tax=Neodiprion lecontei TaxID=441921 RepID=A0A6J0BHJ3_NEOLC|nr:endocuticle structural glycoprotein SgAbd-2 [Neodiprion lecontei]XP_046464761.1 endocuticle structural glycoprotein SgAbd-2-like [Neodiprion pinetum]